CQKPAAPFLILAHTAEQRVDLQRPQLSVGDVPESEGERRHDPVMAVDLRGVGRAGGDRFDDETGRQVDIRSACDGEEYGRDCNSELHATLDTVSADLFRSTRASRSL